ncbi:unnamed protein product [Allacma fusca]|uniref:Ser/Thr-rich protein T10 in DGCR region n=1 Tax=Allacma fusca TaxID=39272 RepID=A0A8J2PK88_9HEXA|nr:unnamed protein product [Allacma fusca]
MCILFMSTSSCPKEDKYKLILAANRDENYSRLSRKAHFWPPDSNIVAGQDVEPGKEGGTWLGMNKQGKVAALLNMPPKPNTVKSQKLGRGL